MVRAGLVALLLLGLCVPAANAADPLRSRQWGLDMVGADQAHAVSTGTGAVVAVIDTGVKADHPDLVGQTLPGHDFVDNDDTPQDGNGHGTHVTGIIDALSGNGVGVESVAPGAKVLPVRVLDDNGDGDSAAVAAGIDWATTHGADVINLSLGGSVPIIGGQSSEFDAALDRALDKGIVVAAAAGNDGLPVCEQPAASGRLLCVGAVDKRGNRSYFSNFGSGLGISAPGGSALPGDDEDILSTYNDGGYAEIAGTSQATPFVSGVAALLVSKGIRGQAAVQRILATARDAGPVGPDTQYGAGIVDAARAVAGLSAGTSSSGSPSSGGGSTPPPPTAATRAAGRVSLAKRIGRRTLLRSGLAARCRAPTAGTSTVTAKLGTATVALGSTPVAAGKTVTVRAHVTRSGKRTIAKRLRSMHLSVVVSCPGLTPKNTHVTVSAG
jgi:serine protease